MVEDAVLVEVHLESVRRLDDPVPLLRKELRDSAVRLLLPLFVALDVPPLPSRVVLELATHPVERFPDCDVDVLVEALRLRLVVGEELAARHHHVDAHVIHRARRPRSAVRRLDDHATGRDARMKPVELRGVLTHGRLDGVRVRDVAERHLNWNHHGAPSVDTILAPSPHTM
jgi:hypothetical protein